MSLSKAALQSLRGEFADNVFRGIGGFSAKYFEGRSWSSDVDTKLLESVELVNKLNAAIPNLFHLGALTEWLAMFQSLFRASDLQATIPSPFRFDTASLSTPGSPLRASIYLKSSDPQTAAADRVRVFGEYSHASTAPGASGEGVGGDADEEFLLFCGCALQVFEAQPTRRFLHGFRVTGTSLELWVFDRSGAYSSEKRDLAQQPNLLVRVLAGYAMMSDEESGLDTFVERRGQDRCVSFSAQRSCRLYLCPELLAAPEYIVGLGTTCYAAARSTAAEPSIVVKFSWRNKAESAEPRLLAVARARHVWGVIELVGEQDLVSIIDLRRGLQFPRPFANRILSCIATTPLGSPIQKFASIHELLEVLRDLVKALRSLYVDGKILHRDICIRNLVISSRHSASGSAAKGVLIDFDQALDLDSASASQPMIGSDGFMAIGILSGQRHTYRHDLESLFYVFLWLAIGNDHEHDDAYDILEHLPATSRLRNWCSMDFASVARDKAEDMSPGGFSALLAEFSDDFSPLRGLAEELHALLFPVHDGKIFTGTETEPRAVERLYAAMAGAFDQSAQAFEK